MPNVNCPSRNAVSPAATSASAPATAPSRALRLMAVRAELCALLEAEEEHLAGNVAEKLKRLIADFDKLAKVQALFEVFVEGS